MKRKRFIDIHIEQPGNPSEPFDVSEYCEAFLKNQKTCFLDFRDKTLFVTTSSWNEIPVLYGILRCFRALLAGYARLYLRSIEHFFWKSAPSKQRIRDR